MTVSVQREQSFRKFLFDGLDSLDKLVSIVYGPLGRRIMVAPLDPHSSPVFISDASKIIRNFTIRDYATQLGVRSIINAAKSIEADSADGIKGFLLLTNDLLVNCFKLVDAGVNRHELIHSLQTVKDQALELLEQEVIPVDDFLIQKTAESVGVNHLDLSGLIAKAQITAGTTGRVELVPSKKTDSENKRFDGYVLEGAPASNRFFDMGQDTIFLQSPLVAILADEVDDTTAIGLLELAQKEGEDLLVLAESFSRSALNVFIRNSQRTSHDQGAKSKCLRTCAAKISTFEGSNYEKLVDAAAITAAQVLPKDWAQLGLSLSDFVGHSDNIEVAEEKIKIPRSSKTDQSVAGRRTLLRSLISGKESAEGSPTAQFSRLEHWQARLDSLSCPLVEVFIGGESSVDQDARIELGRKIERSLSSIKKAGVLPGGGVALLKIQRKIQSHLSSSNSSKNSVSREEKICRNAFVDALDKPFAKLLEYSAKNNRVVAGEILQSDDFWYGYDVVADRYGDLREAGIVDSWLSWKLSLETAVFVCSELVNSDTFLLRNSRPTSAIGDDNWQKERARLDEYIPDTPPELFPDSRIKSAELGASSGYSLK